MQQSIARSCAVLRGSPVRACHSHYIHHVSTQTISYKIYSPRSVQPIALRHMYIGTAFYSDFNDKFLLSQCKWFDVAVLQVSSV